MGANLQKTFKKKMLIENLFQIRVFGLKIRLIDTESKNTHDGISGFPKNPVFRAKNVEKPRKSKKPKNPYNLPRYILRQGGARIIRTTVIQSAF